MTPDGTDSCSLGRSEDADSPACGEPGHVVCSVCAKRMADDQAHAILLHHFAPGAIPDDGIPPTATGGLE